MDTIAAISTPAGVGGIAVVRVSGAKARGLAANHVTMPKSSEPHRPSVGYSLFKVGEKTLDEVVVTCFSAPHSYTGEDVVEIACHGSLYVQQAVLQAFVDGGARLAEPGEFTRRAFLNGRLDLSQAEAVADLISSTNAGAHALAISQLRGGYSQRLRQLRDQFVELTSLLELELDFSDEEVEFADRSQLMSLVEKIDAECRRLSDSFRLGNAIKNGVPVAIVGRPNAGKSTLLNALVGEERAIVSDIAGTTRDTIEDTFVLNGVTFRFIDTAGIRHSNDSIELQGIDRSYRAVEKAQIVLYLVDKAEADTAQQQLEEMQSQVDMADKKVVLLLTKQDQGEAAASVQSHLPTLAISARTGQGLAQLREMLVASINLSAEGSEENQPPMVSNIRHYQALQSIIAAIAQVREGLLRQLPADLVVVDIRDALYHLGTITGQVTSDEVLGSIFSRFCIGK